MKYPIYVETYDNRHEQDSLLVFAVIKGKTELIVSKKRIIVPGGAALVVPSGSFFSIEKNKENTKAIRLCGELVEEELKMDAFFVKNGCAFVEKCLGRIRLYKGNSRENSVIAYELLLEIRENVDENPTQNDMPNIVHDAVEIMNTEVSYLYNVEEIAEEIGVSLPYLSREFKKFMGVSPSVFLRNLRIENAKKMLEDKSVSISIVGKLCGFSELDYFSKVFKKETGMSPTKYRETLPKKAYTDVIPDEAYL